MSWESSSHGPLRSGCEGDSSMVMEVALFVFQGKILRDPPLGWRLKGPGRKNHANPRHSPQREFSMAAGAGGTHEEDE